MKKVITLMITLVLFTAILAPFSIVSASFDEDAEKAKEVANQYIAQDGLTVGEAYPAFMIKYNNINSREFGSVKEEAERYVFEMYDGSQVWGMIMVDKMEDGSFSVNSGMYGVPAQLENLDNYRDDEVIFLLDGADWYYYTKDNSAEQVSIGYLRHSKSVAEAKSYEKTSFTLDEFMNSLKFRQKYIDKPLNPDAPMGGVGIENKSLYQYIGLWEQKQVEQIIMWSAIAVGTVAVILGASIGIAKFKKKKPNPTE